MVKFSIVLPCYESEKTLARALDSIVIQTYKPTEVLVCDDKSKDNFREIVEAYKEKLSVRIVESIYEENKGPAYPRNNGIRESKGEWRVFLDPDDVLLSDALEIFEKNIDENTVAVIGKYNSFDGDKPINIKSNNFLLHGKCFKKDFLIENDIFFNEDEKSCEDIIFMDKLFCLENFQTKTYKYIDDVVYRYIINPNGITFTPKNIGERCFTFSKAQFLLKINEFLNCLVNTDKKEEIIEEAIKRFIKIYYIHQVCLYHRKRGDFGYLRYQENINLFKNVLSTCLKYFGWDTNKLIKEIEKRSYLFTEAKNSIEMWIDGGWYAYYFIEQETIYQTIEILQKEPLFSIVIPCYNCKKTIGQSLESLLKQNFNDFEVLICDDRSDDGFMEVVNKFNEKLSLRYYRTREGEPKGPANARNLGIENAKGKWIVFMDSDDLLLPNTLKRLSELSKGQNALIWGGFRNMPDIYYHSFIALHGKCFNREFLNKFNIRFNKNLFTEEDYNFVNKVLNRIEGEKYTYLNVEELFYEHVLNNNDSMTHRLKEHYFEKTFKDFINGYSEPYFLAIEQYPQLREKWIVFISEIFQYAFYRYQYFINADDDKKRLAENRQHFLWLYNEIKTKFSVDYEWFEKNIEVGAIFQKVTENTIGSKITVLKSLKDILNEE